MSVQALKHRGPDDSGVNVIETGVGTLTIGHTRLSIIDLSLAGHQPMISKDRRFRIVFNGEIYNYREIREQLKLKGHSFSSNSDTEVLLAAWQEWSDRCIQRLCGMFAFAIFDSLNNSLTLVRDAFGIKPLYYHCSNYGFCFASEVPALLRLDPSIGKVDWQTAYSYLAFGDYDNSESTFLDSVYQLKPGHMITLDRSGHKYLLFRSGREDAVNFYRKCSVTS